MGLDEGNVGTRTMEVRMAAGRGTKPEKPVSLASGKEGIGSPSQSTWKFRMLFEHFEKAPGLSHI